MRSARAVYFAEPGSTSLSRAALIWSRISRAAAVRPGLGFVADHACITRWQEHVNRFDRHVWMLAAHNDTHHLTDPQP